MDNKKEKLDLSRPIVYVDTSGFEFPARVVCTDVLSVEEKYKYLFLVKMGGTETILRSDDCGNMSYLYAYFKNVPQKMYIPLFKDEAGYFSGYTNTEKSPEEVLEKHGHKTTFVKVIDFEV